jgi:cbb3-type cytochrome oxidase maturation protein
MTAIICLFPIPTELYTIKKLIYQRTTTTLMNVIFFLIVLSLIFAIGFLCAFIWATRAGQFDDDYTPSVRMLFDDEKAKEE